MSYCKFYARYGTMCGCDERIQNTIILFKTTKYPATMRVEDHRACMGENPELCEYYQPL